MGTNIWEQCEGTRYFKSLQLEAWRIVEVQHVLATRKLVDSAEEQEILEHLIEAAKPVLEDKEFKALHYLLATPFRYPPLLYGSRFGTRAEKSLWYGSLTQDTAMAETAYYRLVFLSGSQVDFGIVEIWLTFFLAQIKTVHGIDLTKQPFTKHQEVISSAESYQASQQLGTAMRTNSVEAFCYISARDPQEGTNVGLFTPKAFAAKKPKANSLQNWQCIANHNAVEFIDTKSLKKISKIFHAKEFMKNNKLPTPAI